MLTIDWLGVFAITARLAIALALLASVALAARSYWQRKQSLKALRMARISPQELHRQLASGDAPVIVDLRHPLDFLASPRTLPKALRISPGEIASRRAELPDNREIVVYCTCPNEATAVRVAKQLRELGVEHVRPLAGGLAGWEQLGFPVDRIFDDHGNSLAQTN
jgi:rhodanese-related sulfurtransferase